MEIILKEDVNKLGHAYDVINVKPGYANNFLIPKKLAVIANPMNRKIYAEIQRQRSAKEAKIRDAALVLSGQLNDISVKIATKVAPSGKIYGSINAIQIVDAIKKQYDFDIDRKKVFINNVESVKEVGSYTAKVSLHRDIVVNINFEVIAEE